MPVIKDKRYREIKEKRTISLIHKTEFKLLLNNVRHQNIEQARAFFILLYYTGGRPAEILDLTPSAFGVSGKNLKIIMPAKKGSEPRVLMLSLKNKHVIEVRKYLAGLLPEQYLFYELRSNKKRVLKYSTSKGKKKSKLYPDVSNNVRYWLKKWVDITPYFFRHNRFSLALDKGASLQQIKYLKGSKRLSSVEIYATISGKKAKETAKYLS